MIILKELKLNNFLSHKDTNIIFHGNEKILLDGKSGSGKSSIAEAILWVLFGQGRVDSKYLIKHGEKNSSVFLKLLDDDIEYTIFRSISDKGKNTLNVTTKGIQEEQFIQIETTGLKDTQNWIEKELLKSSYELFVNSIAYPQDNENSFVKCNASKRKDLLLEIIHSSNFDELYEKTKNKTATLNTEMILDLNNIEHLNNNIKVNETIITTLPSLREKENNIILEIDLNCSFEKQLEEQHMIITGFVDQVKNLNLKKDSFKENIKIITDKLSYYKEKLTEFKLLDINKARENIKVKESLLIEVKNIEEQIQSNNILQMKINIHLSNKPNVQDYSKDIELINQRLIPLIKDSSKCPSGDACPFVIPIKGQIDFLTEQIKQKETQTIEDKEKLNKWGEEYAKLVPAIDTTELYAKLKTLKDKIDLIGDVDGKVITKYEMFEKEIPTIYQQEVELQQEYEKYNIDLQAIDEEIKKVEAYKLIYDSNKINFELSNVRIKIKELRSLKDEITLNIALAKKATENILNDSEKLKSINQDIANKKRDIEDLELLKEALSPRGIKAVIIDYLVPELEDRINGTLSVMSDFKIRLDTQTPKANEDGVKEGLFITFKNPEGIELSINNLSGGEMVKVSMAISEALATLMNSIGFRVLDECINSLDNESTQSFVEVLLKLQEKFPQILCISHLQDVKDIFEKKIEIIKVSGVSQIK